VGRLPKLVHEGFGGAVYATEPTVPLSRIVMEDSARLQEEDAAYKSKRHAREGRRDVRPARPLYTVEDVRRTMPLFRGVQYLQPVKLADGLSITFHDAGHILGSAMLDVLAEGKRII